MADVYNRLDQPDKGLEYCDKSLVILNRIFLENEHLEIADHFNVKGSIYENQEKYELALEFYNKSFDIKNKIFNGEPNLAMASSLNNMASVYLKKGDLSEALEYLKRVDKIKKDTYKDINHLDRVMTLQTIAQVYRDLENYDSALIYIKEALQITEQLTDVDDVLGDILNDSVMIYEHSKEYDYVAALEIYNKSLKYNQNDEEYLAIIFKNIAGVYLKQELHDSALDYYTKSLDITEIILKDNREHVAFVDLYSGIGSVYEKQGK